MCYCLTIGANSANITQGVKSNAPTARNMAIPRFGARSLLAMILERAAVVTDHQPETLAMLAMLAMNHGQRKQIQYPLKAVGGSLASVNTVGTIGILSSSEGGECL